MSEKIKKYTSMRMAQSGNLLTSDICGNNCLFCSNNNNPKEVHTIKVGNRKIQDLIDEIKFFPMDITEIHLGETNLNTTEGDILEYPFFKELILEIKKQRSKANIAITTSGNLLTDDIINFLKKNNISLVISLHSLNPEIRAKITGNSFERANKAIEGFKKCIEAKININVVRLVPMSFIPDEDLYKTLKFLLENNIEEIHIWVASFSKFAKNENTKSLKSECQRIINIIDSLKNIIEKNNFFTRIYLRPFSNFNKIQNIKKNSYATDIGLFINDEIIEINNQFIINGAHAIYTLRNNNFIFKMIIRRNNNFIILKNLNGPMIANSIFIDCFIKYDIIQKISQLIKNDISHTLIMTSEASYNLINESLNKLNLYSHIIQVKNETFGGNICVNGLITINDFLLALNNYKQQNPNLHITKIIVAKDNFITGEKDVTGRPLQDLRVEGCVDVILI